MIGGNANSTDFKFDFPFSEKYDKWIANWKEISNFNLHSSFTHKHEYILQASTMPSSECVFNFPYFSVSNYISMKFTLDIKQICSNH